MFSKHISLILSTLLGLALLTVLVLSFTVFGELKEQRLQTASLLTAVNQRVGVLSAAAADFLKNTSQDMLFLQSLLAEEGSGAAWSEAGLKKFMEKNADYEEFYIFNQAGECLFEVRQGPFVSESSCGKLEAQITKALGAADQLRVGELFVSPLLFYKNTPSLIYAMVLADGRKVIAIVSANPFLEEVRRLSREDEAVFLVDEEGAYLAHENRLKEKFSGGADNFYLDFQEVPKSVLRDNDISTFDGEQRIFSFWRIQPVESDFALYQGMRRAEVLGWENGQWILVAVSIKRE